MVLICGDNATDPFARVRRHASTVPAGIVGSAPLPHACTNGNLETAFQSDSPPHEDAANQTSYTPDGGAYYELVALRGVITRGQP